MPPPMDPLRKTLLLIAVSVVVGCGGAQTTSSAASNVATSGPSAWMSSEVQDAWNSGYKGKGTTITVVDNHFNNFMRGNLSGTTQTQSHGSWTAAQAQLVAPETRVRKIDYNTDAFRQYFLTSDLNIINNSYGVTGAATSGFADLSPLEQATVIYAQNGRAVVVMAAGNEAQPMGSVVGGQTDFFAKELIGTKGTIFVGALDKNGSPDAKASLATYSNTAGNSAQVQSQFLVVGVDAAKTGLAGTSFAAPVVSGYGAILGSKFTTATPTQITNQLLNTARTDTVQGYTPSLHGKGEASLSRALAPAALQ